jgi:hypothetical protein
MTEEAAGQQVSQKKFVIPAQAGIHSEIYSEVARDTGRLCRSFSRTRRKVGMGDTHREQQAWNSIIKTRLIAS